MSQYYAVLNFSALLFDLDRPFAIRFRLAEEQGRIFSARLQTKKVTGPNTTALHPAALPLNRSHQANLIPPCSTPPPNATSLSYTTRKAALSYRSHFNHRQLG